MKLIGTGEFTRAYLDGNTVYLKSRCKVKEVMSLDIFPNSNLFPLVEICYDKDFNYKMKYYPDMKERSVISKLNPYYLSLYRQLRRFKSYLGISFISYVKSLKGIKSYHKDALIEAFESIGVVADRNKIYFEISPRNVAVSDSGKLILIDCFFTR